MHPIVAEQIARDRAATLHLQAARHRARIAAGPPAALRRRQRRAVAGRSLSTAAESAG